MKKKYLKLLRKLLTAGHVSPHYYRSMHTAILKEAEAEGAEKKLEDFLMCRSAAFSYMAKTTPELFRFLKFKSLKKLVVTKESIWFTKSIKGRDRCVRIPVIADLLLCNSIIIHSKHIDELLLKNIALSLPKTKVIESLDMVDLEGEARLCAPSLSNLYKASLQLHPSSKIYAYKLNGFNMNTLTINDNNKMNSVTLATFLKDLGGIVNLVATNQVLDAFKSFDVQVVNFINTEPEVKELYNVDSIIGTEFNKTLMESLRWTYTKGDLKEAIGAQLDALCEATNNNVIYLKKPEIEYLESLTTDYTTCPRPINFHDGELKLPKKIDNLHVEGQVPTFVKAKGVEHITTFSGPVLLYLALKREGTTFNNVSFTDFKLEKGMYALKDLPEDLRSLYHISINDLWTKRCINHKPLQIVYSNMKTTVMGIKGSEIKYNKSIFYILDLILEALKVEFIVLDVDV